MISKCVPAAGPPKDRLTVHHLAQLQSLKL
jgi:hypothetical protein